MPTAGPTLLYARGDMAPLEVPFARPDGSAYDLTGHTEFVLTINSDLDPPDTDDEIMAMVGTLDADPTTGFVGFRPPTQGASDALVPQAGLFYDVQCKTPAGEKKTLTKGGQFTIVQDISKG